VTTAYAGIFPAHAPVPTEEALSADWARVLVTPASTVFVASGAYGMVGSVVARPDAQEAGAGEIARLHVRPDLWRQGLGRRLLHAGLNDLSAAGFRRAGLWVLELNERARAFYERLGWELDPERVLHWTHLGLTEVRYTLELAPPVSIARPYTG
ncbi:MAG TPA: GNAT family N-acetyltransferase, partial [Acidimicrobiales bacterium]